MKTDAKDKKRLNFEQVTYHRAGFVENGGCFLVKFLFIYHKGLVRKMYCRQRVRRKF